MFAMGRVYVKFDQIESKCVFDHLGHFGSPFARSPNSLKIAHVAADDCSCREVGDGARASRLE
jgi:hypothetical protein